MPVESPSAAPMSLVDAVTSANRPWWRQVLRRLLGWGLGLSAGGLGLTLLLWVGLHWFILPQIDQWRPDIETRTSRLLGVPVRIGQISVESKGWSPAIELHDVTLLDAQGVAALTLPKVLATLSARSVWVMSPRFRQLLIEDAHLEVNRDAQGHISVAGLALHSGQPEAGSVDGLDWLLRQTEIAILHSSLRWTDAQRQAPPLDLTQVTLVVRNGLGQHALRLDATPGAELGDHFSVRGKFTQSLLKKPGEWQRWNGTLYAELPRADVSQLKAYAALPFALQDGFGAARAWVDFKNGQVQAATVDVALMAVAAQLSPEVAPLSLLKIQGRFNVEVKGDSHRLSLEQFGFTTQVSCQGQVEWPRGDIKLSWDQADGETIRRGELSADRLDLGVISQIAGHIPLSPALRQALAERQPQGVVQGLTAAWEGPAASPAHYRVKGRIQNLGVRAVAHTEDEKRLGRPGLQGASLDITASDRGGRAEVQIENGEFTFPGLFQEPRVPVTQLSAKLQWRIEPGHTPAEPARITLNVSPATLSNEDLQAEFRATWSNQPDPSDPGIHPGVLDLSGKLLSGRADRVPRYLPQRLPERVRDYLSLALRGGRLSDVNFAVRGDLQNFPFRNLGPDGQPLGEFRIAGQVEDLTLAYVPDRPAHGDAPPRISPWPALSQVGGELIFDRNSMQIRNAHGQYRRIQLNRVQGGINDFITNPTLTLSGQGQGPLADILGFVNSSPVGQWTHGALAQTQATGPAELKLALSIPLNNSMASTVRGSVTMAGNDLRLSPDLPLLEGTRGPVDFTQRGFSLANISTQLMGGESRVEGGWQVDTGLRIKAQGSVTAEGIRQACEGQALAQAATTLAGRTNYRLSLGWLHGHPDILLNSDTVGLAIALPSPLGKAAETAWPVKLQISAQPPGDTPDAPQLDTVNLSVGSHFQAQYLRDISAQPAKVLRGHLSIKSPAADDADMASLIKSPERGVWADLSLATLSLDAWQSLWAKLPSQDAAPASPQAPSYSSYLPSRLSVRTDELVVGSRKLRQVKAQVSQEGGNWRAKLDSDAIDGLIEYQPAHQGTPSKVVAHLNRLNLPPSETTQAQGLSPDRQPEKLPSLDIVIDDLEHRGKKLGRLEVEAGTRPNSADWQISRLTLTTPESTFSAHGQWGTNESGGKAEARRMRVDFKLQLKDTGAFVERLGMARAIKGAQGVMSGQLSWLGSPLNFDYRLTDGQMNVALESGQFLKADAGAAKLLGVLSLQSLPRRLVLDFRDVFQEGFAFDSLTGDVTLAKGIASTNNLRMRGVQAVVLMEGSADLRHETQDLHVVVLPEINAGTASLAYAVINPALGLGTFLAQIFLRKPLAQANSREFHITGSWADPQVERIERKPESATENDSSAPDATPASTPASAPAVNEAPR